MKLKFHGVRGSRPTHKLSTLHFGGNSTFIEFKLEGEDFALLLDGGSGLAHYGKNHLPKNCDNFHFLITHTHWDHILGFPLFEAFYHKKNHLKFYSSTTSKATFGELFFGLQSFNHLPIPSKNFLAQISFEALVPGKDFFINEKIKISTYQINHQGITLAYRVRYLGFDCAVVTDNAPIENGNYLGEGMREKAKQNPLKFEQEFNLGLINFLKDCHTVVYDTHFTEQNLKPDWGHSTPKMALDFCIKASVKRLILFHHAPEDSKEDVLEKLKSVENIGKSHDVEVVLAKEEEEWILA